MLKPTRLIVALFVLLAVSACTAQKVSYDYDQSIDFVAFKSYRWLEQDAKGKHDPRVKNDLMDARIKRSVDNALKARNYIELAEGDVDFNVTYQVGIEKRTEADRVRTGIGFGYSYWDLGFQTDTIVREYDQVTLYLDVIDPKTKKLIWRGTREYRYRSGGSVADKDARIQQMVGEILGGFPP